MPPQRSLRESRYSPYPPHRYLTYQTPQKVTYATDIYAYSTPDAVDKINWRLRDVQINKDVSLFSGNRRLFSGESRTIMDVERRFQQRLDDMEGRMRVQETEIRILASDRNSLVRKNEILLRDRNSLIKKEILCAFYTAVGHPQGVPRSFTFRWMKHRQTLLQSIFGADRNAIISLLSALDPGDHSSLIKVGNVVAHQHSLLEAREVVTEQPLRMIVDLLASRCNGETNLHSAASEVQLHLLHDYPELEQLAEVDKAYREKEKEELIEEIIGRLGRANTASFPLFP